MVIDANMYWFEEELFEDEGLSEAFLSEIPQSYGTKGTLQTTANGARQIVIEKPSGYQNLNYVQGEYRLERMLADMDAAGVEQAILKMPGCQEWMSLATCKRFNDGMARYVQQSGGRLQALAVLPPQGTAACLAELDRCLAMGFKGVQLSAHYGKVYLDDPMFAPFFARLNELALTVYVHHTPIPVNYESLLDYDNLRRSYGRCVDQATAIGRELFSGFFDRYPNLKFVHSMLGGAWFGIAQLMAPHKPGGAQSVARFSESGGTYEKRLAENIFFETSHAQPWGKKQLECAVEVLGADHIIFGTSYPVRQEWLLGGPAFVRALDITEQEKENILFKNAQRLYHMK